MFPPILRIISLGFVALALAGCASTGDNSLSGGARPKSIVVTDFVLSSDVAVIDRGYTARLERKIGPFPTFERKTRTIDRVNDEIVASIVATLREAGLPAQAGSADSLTLNDEAVVVSGRLRPTDKPGKKQEIGFGGGRGGVVADMTVSSFSAGGRRQLISYSAAAADAGKPLTGKQASARSAAIAAALGSGQAATVKLSPDVETQARRTGRAIGEKFLAYAKEQGWLATPAAAEAPVAEQAPPLAPKPAPKRVAAPKPAQGQPSTAAPPRSDNN